jgi:hypothetical protein
MRVFAMQQKCYATLVYKETKMKVTGVIYATVTETAFQGEWTRFPQ